MMEIRVKQKPYFDADSIDGTGAFTTDAVFELHGEATTYDAVKMFVVAMRLETYPIEGVLSAMQEFVDDYNDYIAFKNAKNKSGANVDNAFDDFEE